MVSITVSDPTDAEQPGRSFAFSEPPTTPDLRPEPVSRGGTPFEMLVVEDDSTLRTALVRYLGRIGYGVTQAPDGESAVATFRSKRIDIALVDVLLPGSSGLELLTWMKQADPDVVVVMMTGHLDMRTAVRAVKSGAFDFLTKPFSALEAVGMTVRKAAEHRRVILEARRAEERLEQYEPFGGMVGSSEALLRTCQVARQVASTASSVLVLGETGTGKELVARAIHQASPRASGPFVPVNCSAIAPELIESELFGHERGAFTGATNRRAGFFEHANGGTLFLDEIGDLPLPAQAKLLRVLQDGEVRKVGSDVHTTIDARIVAATNVNLKAKVAAGTFRQDLYYRLDVVRVEMPPLRHRKEDIPALVDCFIRKHASRLGVKTKAVGVDALWRLMEYDWPGNVRELENTVERALVVSTGPTINAHAVGLRPSIYAPPPCIEPTPSPAPPCAMADDAVMDMPFAAAKQSIVQKFEAEYVRRLLERTGGNVSEAARLSGLDRSSFRRIVRRAGAR